MVVKGMVLCPIFLLFQTSAICTVTKPSSLEYSVGDNATLRWTATKKMVQVRFGLYDSSIDDVSPQFVSVNILAGVQYTNLTNTAAARYTGRVIYNGNLTLGHAWINLTNLEEDDFKETYVACIREFGDVGETNYLLNLTLKAVESVTSTVGSSTVKSTGGQTSQKPKTEDSVSPAPMK